MPRNNKLFIVNSVVEVTFRAEEGLPFPPKANIKAIITGILARAQTLYPIKICSVMLMSNHFHLILVVIDPQNVHQFVGYVKRETAHALNHMLGRKQHTVWQEGYDSPCLCSSQVVIDRLVYHLTNPQRAGLVDSIEEYPNLNTWSALTEGNQTIKAKRICRDKVPELKNRQLNEKKERQLAADILEGKSEELVLLIEPNAWMSCFEESRNADPEFLNAEIIRRVKESESALRQNRTKAVMGAEKLRRQQINAPHTPKEQGRKSIALDTKRKRLRVLLKWFKEKQEEARIARKLREGENPKALLPPGFFLSGGKLPLSITLCQTPLGDYFA